MLSAQKVCCPLLIIDIGVEVGDDPTGAVVRETYEECGLVLAEPVYLGSFEWQTDAPSQIRNFFWLQVPIDTADHWEHRVSPDDALARALRHPG
jgi:8-oxo-dGTP pyrophosphatase MutT (NUDIX family)